MDTKSVTLCKETRQLIRDALQQKIGRTYSKIRTIQVEEPADEEDKIYELQYQVGLLNDAFFDLL